MGTAGKGTVGAQHGMCELAIKQLQTWSEKEDICLSIDMMI
jgi:hypothetical protein